jgi:hypothetical protein
MLEQHNDTKEFLDVSELSAYLNLVAFLSKDSAFCVPFLLQMQQYPVKCAVANAHTQNTPHHYP